MELILATMVEHNKSLIHILDTSLRWYDNILYSHSGHRAAIQYKGKQ